MATTQQMSFEVSRSSVTMVIKSLSALAPGNIIVLGLKAKAEEILQRFPETLFKVTIEGVKL